MIQNLNHQDWTGALSSGLGEASHLFVHSLQMVNFRVIRQFLTHLDWKNRTSTDTYKPETTLKKYHKPKREKNII